jgi:hypothetical protein
MKNTMLNLFVIALASGATAFAGSFTNDFSDPNNTAGFTLNGSGVFTEDTTWMPVIQDHALLLTTNLGGLMGTIVLDDLDSGAPIESITARFKLLLNGAADGLALSFGPDITSGALFGETGGGLSSGGFTISFDLYNNGAPDFIGISVYLPSGEIGLYPVPLSSPDFKDVVVQLNRNGTLNLTWGDTVVYRDLDLPGYSYVNGQLAFGGRTGGSTAIQAVADLGVTTTVAGEARPASITSQPQTQTVNEHQSVTFRFGYDGTPPFTFQWYKDGASIADATNNILILDSVAATDQDGKYKCTVANTTSVTTQEATLNVTADKAPPAVVSAAGSDDSKHVTVVFSEPVTASSAQNANNYRINNLTVTAAALSTNDHATVLLTTSVQAPATVYTVTINNIKDTSSAANAIAADTKITFKSEELKVAGVGALLGQDGTAVEVGVNFNLPYDVTSASKTANYTLSAGTIVGLTTYPSGSDVVLKANGLAPGGSYTLSVANVTDGVGNTMSAVTVPFTVSSMKWGVVGADQLQLGNGLVALGNNGFDLYSDGYTEWGTYDEATFTYEEITGDFDKKVRVEYQESSSQWARAGLIARDVTNFGVSQDVQAGSGASSPPFDGLAGRYQKVHVNPVVTAMGTAGNNSWEGNRRLITGGPTTTAGGGGTPQYPHAWCRLQRVGQTFTIYSSNDGKTWTRLGVTTWGTDSSTDNQKMPDKVFVGLDYSPENGNVSDEALRRMFFVRFRDYGDTFPTIPQLTAVRSAAGLKITYTGTLQFATTIQGPWNDVNGASSPYIAPTTGPQMFYRARK